MGRCASNALPEDGRAALRAAQKKNEECFFQKLGKHVRIIAHSPVTMDERRLENVI
jgi:hypothetical protein